jgi:hypothetical protein
MTPKEKLLWLAENANEDFSNVECYIATKEWLILDNRSSLNWLLEKDIRLTQSEIERRNPGFEVLTWMGRRPDDEVDRQELIHPDKYYYDGWLLRRKEEKPESKPVLVKAWVRWPVTAGDKPELLVTGRDKLPAVRIGEKWYDVKNLIADGCEHTDTPDDETSWQKIGGNQ